MRLFDFGRNYAKNYASIIRQGLMHGSFTRYAEQTRKSCTPERKKTKTLIKVEEFENRNILPDRFWVCKQSKRCAGLVFVTFVSFSPVHMDPVTIKIVFILFVM